MFEHGKVPRWPSASPSGPCQGSDVCPGCAGSVKSGPRVSELGPMEDRAAVTWSPLQPLSRRTRSDRIVRTEADRDRQGRPGCRMPVRNSRWTL